MTVAEKTKSYKQDPAYITQNDKWHLLEEVRMANWPHGMVYICHGLPRCLNIHNSECRDCYSIQANDPRSSREILKQLRRVN